MRLCAIHWVWVKSPYTLCIVALWVQSLSLHWVLCFVLYPKHVYFAFLLSRHKYRPIRWALVADCWHWEWFNRHACCGILLQPTLGKGCWSEWCLLGWLVLYWFLCLEINISQTDFIGFPSPLWGLCLSASLLRSYRGLHWWRILHSRATRAYVVNVSKGTTTYNQLTNSPKGKLN